MKQFINLADFTPDAVEVLVKRAQELREHGPTDAAKGMLLGLLFMNPSLRTRTSMVGAWAYLGGQSVSLSQTEGTYELATGDGPMLGSAAEHIEEAAGVLGRLCDVLGVRAFASGTVWAEDRKDSVIQTFARLSRAPFVNLESGMYHPCQALADRLTLEDKQINKRSSFVLSWAYHPKALPQAVANSALLMATQRGMNVTVLRPEGYTLDADVMAKAHEFSKVTGGSLKETDDVGVLRTTDVVYVKSWCSLPFYSDREGERKLREKYKHWCVGNESLPVGERTKFMHCLPIRRDVKATKALITGKNSLILDQAENRKWAQVAVLDSLLKSM
ncbi:MAG: N-acetylornithine carbamoyltransferase [Planctomycetaceae bacterium]|nr:N-acetylornithine carbamoyltransferase [Planctomycetaceae bacterium]